MANIINDPAFKKKLEQMTPQVPPLSGEVELPNLGQIAQQTAQQVLPQQPLVSEQQSRAESIREGAMDIGRGILSTVGQGVRNIAQAPGAAADVLFDPSRPSMSDVMSERGMRTIFDGGDAVIPQAPPEGVFTPREQVLGEATRPPAQLGQTARGTMGIEPQAPVSAQVAPPAAAQPQAPQAGSGGLISFDTGARAGQTFFGDETGVGAVSQQNAAQIGRGFDETYGQRSYGDISITGPSGQPIDPNSTRYDASRLTPEMQANVQAGRPPNVSAAQVGQAQQEAVARQADYEQRQVNNRIDSQMRQWERDNPRATEEATAMQRQQLMQQEALVQKPKAAQDGGLTFDQKLALRKQEFTEGVKGAEIAEKGEEKSQAQAELFKKEQDLYSLHEDSFDRQERYIEQALNNTGILSTGFASISKFLPGTPARNLEESLKPILGEAAFGRLQQMRDASKTGGALGQVSERELGLLESAMGALASSQSEPQFRANLLAYRKQLRESNKRMKEAARGQSWFGNSEAPKSTKYDNDSDYGDSAESYYNPSK